MLFFLALLPIFRLLLELQLLPKPTPVLVPLPKLAPLLMLMLQLVLKPMLGPQHQLELQPIIAYQPGLQLEPAVQLKAITLPGQQLMDQQLRLRATGSRMSSMDMASRHGLMAVSMSGSTS